MGNPLQPQFHILFQLEQLGLECLIPSNHNHPSSHRHDDDAWYGCGTTVSCIYSFSFASCLSSNSKIGTIFMVTQILQIHWY